MYYFQVFSCGKYLLRAKCPLRQTPTMKWWLWLAKDIVCFDQRSLLRIFMMWWWCAGKRYSTWHSNDIDSYSLPISCHCKWINWFCLLTNLTISRDSLDPHCFQFSKFDTLFDTQIIKFVVERQLLGLSQGNTPQTCSMFPYQGTALRLHRSWTRTWIGLGP